MHPGLTLPNQPSNQPPPARPYPTRSAMASCPPLLSCQSPPICLQPLSSVLCSHTLVSRTTWTGKRGARDDATSLRTVKTSLLLAVDPFVSSPFHRLRLRWQTGTRRAEEWTRWTGLEWIDWWPRVGFGSPARRSLAARPSLSLLLCSLPSAGDAPQAFSVPYLDTGHVRSGDRRLDEAALPPL